MSGSPGAADEVAGLADLIPQLAGEIVLPAVRDTHAAIAATAFRAVPASGVVRAVHDAVAGTVYGLLARSARLLRRSAAAVALATNPGGRARPVGRSRGWQRTQAALNGVLGDRLQSEGSPLAIPMAVRVAGRDVPLTTADLTAAFPEAGTRVAVLVHGLVESEHGWVRGRYHRALVEHGVTPVFIRYNSGRHISDTATDLSMLLETLLQQWPQEVSELILIGHSMGGLAIRGAAAQAAATAAMWPDRTSDVVMLGSPHSGSGLEKTAHVLGWLLSLAPQSAAIGRLLRQRSVGIKDLRHGYVLTSDVAGLDPDARVSAPAGRTGRVGVAGHHVVAATLGQTRQHVRSRLFGDLLVSWRSGSAADHGWAVQARLTHLGRTTHFALLDHPTITDLLHRIVTGTVGDGSDVAGNVTGLNA